MENNQRKLLRTMDALIIVLIAATVFVFYTFFPESNGETAVISWDGSVIAEFPLDDSGEYICPEVPDMVFTVVAGTISVTESSCGDKTCVRTGKISKRGEAIICVPNKIIVEIKGKSTESGVDAVL